MQRSPEGAAINYYERHLGDYARDTAHLTMVEHGAYTLLLDRYYATESPIPADQAHRLTRARTKEERAAVDAVLAEFFTLEDGAWKSRRADAEIAKARVRIDAAQSNGKRGGRPRKETQQKPSGFSLGSETGTQPKAHQTPDTKHQTEALGNSSGDGSSEVGARPDDRPTEMTPGGAACRAMRNAGMPAHTLNPENAELLEAIKAGATPAEFGATAAELIASGKPQHMTYVIRTVVGRRNAAARARAAPSARPSVADNFAHSTYTGTADDDLPEHLRPAA